MDAGEGDAASWHVERSSVDDMVYVGPEGRVYFSTGIAHEVDGSPSVRDGQPVLGIGLTDLRDASHSPSPGRILSSEEQAAVIDHVRIWAKRIQRSHPFDLCLSHGIEDEAGNVRPYPSKTKRERKKWGSRISRRRI